MGKKYLEDSITLLEDLKIKGCNYVCLGCLTVYQEKPTQDYDDGHGGRLLEMCRCGGDLFENIDETILRLKKSLDDYKG